MKNDSDFPEPVQYVSDGRIALYLELDILAYEEKKPWVKDKIYRDARREWIFKNQFMD